jgi:hypothetical protein
MPAITPSGWRIVKPNLAWLRIRHRLAGGAAQLGCGGAQKIEAIMDFEAGLAGDGTRFFDDDLYDFIGFGGESVGRAQKYGLALRDDHVRPVLIGGMGGADRLLGFGSTRLVHPGIEGAGCRIMARRRLVAR